MYNLGIGALSDTMGCFSRTASFSTHRFYKMEQGKEVKEELIERLETHIVKHVLKT